MDVPAERRERSSRQSAWYGPDVLRNSLRILLINLKGRDLHIDQSGLDLRMSHQLHERRQTDTGAHHI